MRKKSIGFLPTLVLGLATAIVSIGPVRAAPVTYTEQATATGSLDGVAYTNANVVLTMTNDTTNVINNGFGAFTINGTTTVSVGGGPSETFTDATHILVSQTDALVVFADTTQMFGILNTTNAALATYDLTTSIGPISGTVVIDFGLPFPTSSGVFSIDSIAGESIFTAVVSTVPEPSSLTLLAMAFAGLGLLRRRALLHGSAAG